MINQFNQDDIFVEMTFLRSLEKHGFDLSIRDAGIDFANSRYWTAHANNRGRDNLREALHHPGQVTQSITSMPMISITRLKLIMRELSLTRHARRWLVGLGNIFGRLMNYGDGLYGGNFVAGMYAEAFFEDDVEKIILAGLNVYRRAPNTTRPSRM